MKILFYLILCACFSSLLSSCAITLPYAVTENPIGSKIGKSTNNCLFGVPASKLKAYNATSIGVCFNGNYGLYEACKNGGITKGVATVDLKTTNYIFFYQYELIVSGE